MVTNARLPAVLALSLSLLASAGVPAAQQGRAPSGPGSDTGSEGATGAEVTVAQTEKIATDLREAINENMVIPEPAQDSPEAAQADDFGTDQPATPDDPAETGPAEADAAEPEEKPWYAPFNTVTNNLQSLPDRLPGLGGKGWIHFGRIEAEYGNFSSGGLSDESGFNFRSLRGGIIRQFDEGRMVKLEIDVTDGDSNWVDLWGRFKTRAGVFTLGNQKIAQTLVIQTSRLARTFMEVPLPSEAFGLGRRLGIGWDLHRNRAGAHMTAFGEDLNDHTGDFGYGARIYFNPAKTRFNMFHVGISAVREKMDRDAQFRSRPETRVTDIRLVDTGLDADVDTQSIYGLEMAGARDNWSVRGEYFRAEWDRISSADTVFDGYYLQANLALTGESFKYDQGKFLRIRPQGQRGAWEISARYSYIDLNDLEVQGGKERNASVGLNWYGPGNQFRAMANLIFVNTDAVAGNRDPVIFQVRVQLNW